MYIHIEFDYTMGLADGFVYNVCVQRTVEAYVCWKSIYFLESEKYTHPGALVNKTSSGIQYFCSSKKDDWALILYWANSNAQYTLYWQKIIDKKCFALHAYSTDFYLNFSHFLCVFFTSLFLFLTFSFHRRYFYCYFLLLNTLQIGCVHSTQSMVWQQTASVLRRYVINQSRIRKQMSRMRFCTMDKSFYAWYKIVMKWMRASACVCVFLLLQHNQIGKYDNTTLRFLNYLKNNRGERLSGLSARMSKRYYVIWYINWE